MVGVDREPVLREGGRCERREELITDFEHRPAPFADKMAVRRGGEVVGRRAVPEVHVGDNAEAFEFLEVAVDGRDMDVGSLNLNLGGEILRGPVVGRPEQRPQDQPPGGRRPPAGRPQAPEHVSNGLVDRRVVGLVVLRWRRFGWTRNGDSPVGHLVVGPAQFRRVGDVTTPRVRVVEPATRTA